MRLHYWTEDGYVHVPFLRRGEIRDYNIGYGSFNEKTCFENNFMRYDGRLVCLAKDILSQEAQQLIKEDSIVICKRSYVTDHRLGIIDVVNFLFEMDVPIEVELMFRLQFL